MNDEEKCAICNGPTNVFLTQIDTYCVSKIHFCEKCAGHIFSDNNTAARLGNALKKMPPLEIPPETILQARATSLSTRITNAKTRLNAAIAAESYEKAALWRDELNRLTKNAALIDMIK